MALEDYLPFDPDSRDTDTGDDIDELFDLLGIDTWRDVMIDQYDPDEDLTGMRGHLYKTVEEAFRDIVDRGIWWFTEIAYDYETDTYSIVVQYE